MARGPLVIMAHGLLALDPRDRGTCWIRCRDRDLTSGQAEEALRIWFKGAC